MTLVRSRRSLVRLLVVAVLAAAAVGSDAARSQITDEPGPAERIRVDDTVAPPVGEERDGLAVTEDQGQTQARLGVTATDVVSTECANGPGSRTRLGLLERSAVQSYCHGITGPG